MNTETALAQTLEAKLTALGESMNRNIGDSLVSLTLYGSAARGLYQPGFSDVNLLLVVARADSQTLGGLRACLSEAADRQRITPYLVAERELPDVAEAFPTRVVEMKRGYRVLRGLDVLAGLTVDSGALAGRCRQELLNLLMRFRHLLLARRDPEALERYMHQCLPPFVKILRTLVYLKTGQHIDDRGRVIEESAARFGLSLAPLKQLIAWRAGEVSFSGGDWDEAAQKLFDALEKTSEQSHG